MKVAWLASAAHGCLLEVAILAGDCTAAARFRHGIAAAVSTLRHRPDAGRVGEVAGTRELPVPGDYLVVYRVSGQRVEILRVFLTIWPATVN
jgi:plasmid stabilization system protein ParE